MAHDTNLKNGIERVPVFYTPRMVANISSFSPSAGKPARVVSSWQRLDLPIEIIAPKPVSADEFKLVHRPYYVDQVLACEIKNGFGNRMPEVAETLLYTTGSMLSAAREAIRNRKVAVAPCSGFHHAGYASAVGFCTFNGLMVTAMKLKAEGLVQRVGILDYDMHYGNGTQELIERHRAASWIEHYSAGEDYHSARQAADFMARIPNRVEEMRGCDVLLYQAGADPHVDDPLGGFLTTNQLRERDKLVFELADLLGIPVAWNLAGGYQVDSGGGIQAVLDIHNNTILECAAVYVKNNSEQKWIM
jgi:acetoin utilization deacetylase AcuC-like enzyme